jgi:hypothetical protein
MEDDSFREAMFALLNGRDAPNVGVGEDVEFIATTRGELRHDASSWPCLKPVFDVGLERVLLTGAQDDFVPNGEVLLAVCGWPALRVGGRSSFHVQVHLPLSAAKGFFFAGIFADWRMAVFGEALMWEHDQFLGTTAFRVHVDHELQTERFDFAEATIGDFDVIRFGRGQHDSRVSELCGGALAQLRYECGGKCRHVRWFSAQ